MNPHEDAYRRAIATVDRLDEAEVESALCEYRNGDKAQQRRISESYLPLALEIAEQTKSRHPDLELLVIAQEANAALQQAIDLFTEYTATEFSTFARAYIAMALDIALGLNGLAVRQG